MINQEKIKEEFENKFPYEQGLFNTKSGYLIKIDPYEILDFISQALKSQRIADREELVERIVKMKKLGMNGENLPFENSPEIYGNQRIEAYKNGYNKALENFINLISPLSQEGEK